MYTYMVCVYVCLYMSFVMKTKMCVYVYVCKKSDKPLLINICNLGFHSFYPLLFTPFDVLFLQVGERGGGGGAKETDHTGRRKSKER